MFSVTTVDIRGRPEIHSSLLSVVVMLHLRGLFIWCAKVNVVHVYIVVSGSWPEKQPKNHVTRVEYRVQAQAMIYGLKEELKEHRLTSSQGVFIDWAAFVF